MRLKSLKTRMILAFCIIAIIPNIIISGISLGNTVRIVEQNVTELTQSNLEQVKKNGKLTLSGYGDLIYQLYINDEIVELVEKINNGEDVFLCRNQLIRELRQMADVKNYIASIMFIPRNGEEVFYDKLTGASTKSSWMNDIGMSKEDLYKKVAESNKNVLFPTQKYAVSGQDYYLFHAAHRLIDYRNINKDVGIVVFSFNTELIDSICNEETSEKISGINFMLNEKKEIMSFPGNYGVGTKLYKNSDSVQKREVAVQRFIKKAGLFSGKEVIINSIVDADSGWTIINVADRDILMGEIDTQRSYVLFMIVISSVLSCCLSLLIASQLTESISDVKHTMEEVSFDNLSKRVNIDNQMPEEVEVIAKQFNYTMDKLEDSIQKERLATEKQKEAELKFLEAQINPHFLYNTLDTINWMAIDNDQYEISNVINALAYILRYGIEENNKEVPISSDIEWLKKYIFLQQSRIMTEIDCQIKVEPDLMNCQIHKLLLQPFVENAIIHGVDKTKDKFILGITIEKVDHKLKITISDNGKGMGEDVVKKFGSAEIQSGKRGHIGVKNAIERIRMYYGDDAKVEVESVIGEGTSIMIVIPEIKREDGTYENNNS